MTALPDVQENSAKKNPRAKKKFGSGTQKESAGVVTG